MHYKKIVSNYNNRTITIRIITALTDFSSFNNNLSAAKRCSVFDLFICSKDGPLKQL